MLPVCLHVLFIVGDLDTLCSGLYGVDHHHLQIIIYKQKVHGQEPLKNPLNKGKRHRDE